MIHPMMTLILSQKLHMNAGTIAIVMVVFSLVLIPLNLLGGKLADKFSKKNLLILCSGIAIVCYFICTVLPLSYGSMIIFAFAAAVLQMCSPCYSALVADITPSDDRNRAYSLNYLGLNLGMVLSPTIAGFLFKDYLWLMFLISGLALIASTALLFFFLHDTEQIREVGSAYEQADESASILAVLKQNKIIVLFLVIIALDSAVYNQYSYLIPLELGSIHGDNGAVIYGTLSSLNCLVVVLFTPVITRIYNRRTDTQKILISDVLMLFSYILFRFTLGFIPAYYVVMIVYTWGEIFRTIACDPYLTKRIPSSHRGRLLAFNNMTASLAYGISEICVGQVYDHIGSLAAWLLIFAISAAGILLEIRLLSADRKAYPEIYQKHC